MRHVTRPTDIDTTVAHFLAFYPPESVQSSFICTINILPFPILLLCNLFHLHAHRRHWELTVIACQQLRMSLGDQVWLSKG